MTLDAAEFTFLPAMTKELEPKLGKVLDFMRLLWAVDHGLQTVSKRMHAEYGVTGLQRMMVRIVGRFPAIAAKDLASILHVHPSTLTGALDKLEREGAIERKVDPEDGRRAQLSLGALGRTINEIRAGTVEAALRRALASVKPEEVDAAATVLQAIARELAED